MTLGAYGGAAEQEVVVNAQCSASTRPVVSVSSCAAFSTGSVASAVDDAGQEEELELLVARPLATDVAEPLTPTISKVDLVRNGELPEAWARAARRTAGVRVLSVRGRPGSPWADSPAPIVAFGWRDCQPVLREILARAREYRARAVVIGHPEWQEQAAILRQGGWVLPEPPCLDELLSWLVSTGGSPDGSAPQEDRALAAPILRVNATLRYVVVDGQEVPLQPRELALLELLGRGGAPCASTQALSQALLAAAGARQRRLLAQHLHSLRRKLGRLGTHIEFTRVGGYRTWLRVRWLHIAPPAGGADRSERDP